jgi:hypothetical protein
VVDAEAEGVLDEVETLNDGASDVVETLEDDNNEEVAEIEELIEVDRDELED